MDSPLRAAKCRAMVIPSAFLYFSIGIITRPSRIVGTACSMTLVAAAGEFCSELGLKKSAVAGTIALSSIGSFVAAISVATADKHASKRHMGIGRK